MTDLYPDHIAGVLTPNEADVQHRLFVRVYFEDTDFSGVVYHARYLHFFERGRSDFLRLTGVRHRDLEDGHYGEPLFFVVKSMALDFAAPARIDDVLAVETAVIAQQGVRLEMQQRLRRAEDLIAEVRVTIVMINRDGKLRRIPKELAAKLVKA